MESMKPTENEDVPENCNGVTKFKPDKFLSDVKGFCSTEIRNLANKKGLRNAAQRKLQKETDTLATLQKRYARLETASIENLASPDRSYDKDKINLRKIKGEMDSCIDAIEKLNTIIFPRLNDDVHKARVRLGAKIEAYCKESAQGVADEVTKIYHEAEQLMAHASVLRQAFLKLCQNLFGDYSVKPGMTFYDTLNRSLPAGESQGAPQGQKHEGTGSPNPTVKVKQLLTKDGKSFYCKTQAEQQVFESNHPGTVAETYDIELAEHTANSYLNADHNKAAFIPKETAFIAPAVGAKKS